MPGDKLYSPEQILYLDKVISIYEYDGYNRLIELENRKEEGIQAAQALSISYSSSSHKVTGIKFTSEADELGLIEPVVTEYSVTYNSDNILLSYKNTDGKDVKDTVLLNTDKAAVTYGFIKEYRAARATNSYYVDYDFQGNLSKITRNDGSYMAFGFDDKTGAFSHDRNEQWLKVVFIDLLPNWFSHNIITIKNYDVADDGEKYLSKAFEFNYTYNEEGYPDAYNYIELHLSPDIYPDASYDFVINYGE